MSCGYNNVQKEIEDLKKEINKLREEINKTRHRELTCQSCFTKFYGFEGNTVCGSCYEYLDMRDYMYIVPVPTDPPKWLSSNTDFKK